MVVGTVAPDPHAQAKICLDVVLRYTCMAFARDERLERRHAPPPIIHTRVPGPTGLRVKPYCPRGVELAAPPPVPLVYDPRAELEDPLGMANWNTCVGLATNESFECGIRGFPIVTDRVPSPGWN